MTLTAAIISEKLDLSPMLLDSLSFADEIIIIVDTPSVIPGYDPESIPSQHLKTFSRPLNNDFAAQRNFALEKAKSDWVLFVDDDEYVGTELAREIKSVLTSNKFSGFLIPRLDVVFHQPLLHGETGRLKLLRLAHRTRGEFHRSVHEYWKISGRVGELISPLYHRKDHFVSGFMARLIHYGPIDAHSLRLENKPFSWFRLFIYPPAKFKYNYFFKAGFLDGLAGLFQAYLMAVQSLTVRVFQWENKN